MDESDGSARAMAFTDHPRYKNNPMNLLFEAFIRDTIGHLPAEKARAVEQMNLPSRFKTQATDWRGAIAEVLHLSDTITIAILDLWYRNCEIGKQQGVDYDPIQFSMDFVDHFYEEGSRVDVWEGDALQAAKERIARHGHVV
jgi:hypothetical protein